MLNFIKQKKSSDRIPDSKRIKTAFDTTRPLPPALIAFATFNQDFFTASKTLKTNSGKNVIFLIVT